MSECNSNDPHSGDTPLKLEADSDSIVEVQIMDDISCVISDPDGSDDGEGQFSFSNVGAETLIKRLLTRVRILESQVASCLENQPLLYQVFGKCNVLEQRLKVMKKDVDGRLTELEEDTNRTKGPGTSRSSTTFLLKRPENTKNRPDIEFDQFDSGSEKEWEPDQEGEDERGNQEILGVDPTSEHAEIHTAAVTRSRSRRNPNSQKNSSSDTPSRTTPKLFRCKFCPNSALMAFDDATSLANHYTSTHSLARKGKDAPCGVGTAANISRRLKATSVAPRKTPRPTSFPCRDGCGRIFKHKGIEGKHLIACRGLKPQVCQHCGKAYAQLPDLQNHLATAHGEGKTIGRWETCSECGRSMLRKYLQNHMETHAPMEERQRHYCDQCGQSFLRQVALRKHCRQHTEPPAARIPCDICTKTFKDSESHRRHKRLHTNRGRFVCDECGWGFPMPHLLRKHKENHAKGTARKKSWTLVAPTPLPPPM